MKWRHLTVIGLLLMTPGIFAENDGENSGSTRPKQGPRTLSFGTDKIYLADSQGQGQKGSAKDVLVELQKLGADQESIYRWRIVRIDPPENAEGDATNSIFRVFLERSKDGQTFEGPLLAQWVNRTGNIIDLGADKLIDWEEDIPRLLEQVEVSPGLADSLKQEIQEQLKDEKTMQLSMFPKQFYIKLPPAEAAEAPRHPKVSRYSRTQGSQSGWTIGLPVGALPMTLAVGLGNLLADADKSFLLSAGDTLLYSSAAGVLLTPVVEAYSKTPKKAPFKTHFKRGALCSAIASAAITACAAVLQCLQ